MCKQQWFLLVILWAMVSVVSQAQIQVYQTDIELNNLNIRGQPVTLAQIDLTADQSGSVYVRFDGYAILTPGDRVIVAASDEPDWNSFSGSVGLEAFDADGNRRPFSHSRVYQINPGDHTFYAVAENAVEEEGSGFASFFGRLTVKYYPNTGSGAFLFGQSIQLVNNTSSVVNDQFDFLANPSDGTACFHFDANVIQGPGFFSFIELSNIPDDLESTSSVRVNSINNDINQNPISISQAYDIQGDIFSAFREIRTTLGDPGQVPTNTVMGNLVVEYLPPGTGFGFFIKEPVEVLQADVFNGPIVLGQIDMVAPTAGKVLVTYDGLYTGSPLNRVIVGVNNQMDLADGAGHTQLETPGMGGGTISFSHSGLFNVNPGAHSFYALADVSEENSGQNPPFFYTNLIVQFIPDLSTSVEDPVVLTFFEGMTIAPNPSAGPIEFRFQGQLERSFDIEIYDVQGRIVRRAHIPSGIDPNWQVDLSNEPAGLYYISLIDESGILTTPISIQR
ncbi:MAG: T9SS type A sorting domain-containing protein [Bacteroidota bacterium]